MVRFVADYVIDEIRDRAKCWRADEISALNARHETRAAQCRIRAAVLEQLASDFESQKATIAA